ncbi:uncharacterized protein LOC143452940 [Clavelina lepadiformis]|uniref:uncharacterized protein LOC143452940 n=1 Tax=Clavelina lepadiformis TaxID=159417 RepID=UPI00404393E3
MSSNLPPTFVEGFHDVKDLSKMKYTQLGKTDMIVSSMTFGGSAIGSVYRATDDQESVQVVEKAIQLGINMIDTAPWYGHTKSEKVLGMILPKFPRQAYYLNTKVGRYLPETSKMFDFRAERVIQSVDESLNHLGVEYIDTIQIHDMEFAPSLDIVINETLPALQKVKDAGKVRHIGITGYPMENFRTVLEKSPVKIDTVLTYCHASMNDNSLGEYIPYFQSKGVGVINASILSMGLLTNRGPAKWHRAGENIRSVCRQAAEFCQSKDVDIAKIATRFSLEQPGIHTTLIGTASMKNLLTNLEVLKHGITDHERKVSDEVMDKFFKPLNNANWEGVDVRRYREKLSENENDVNLG